MNRKDRTAAIIDGLLKFGTFGGVIFVGLAAPNAIQSLDKPLNLFFNQMDKRSRQREYRRVVYYMKQQGLLELKSENYQHGLVITKAGKKRLRRYRFANLAITAPKKWDKRWRLVFFDIPETKKSGRNALVFKLKRLGFQQLQRSVWIYPFACRAEIEFVADYFKMQQYISYVEAVGIDNEAQLKKRFAKIIN